MLVGGAVLTLQWGVRTTNDVDFINDNLPGELGDAIAAVGKRNGLSENWMNDAAKINVPYTKNLYPEFHLLFTGKNIQIYSPGAKFLLATKLFSARQTDFEDCLFLISQTDIESAEEMLDLLELAYPFVAIPAKCRYYILYLAEAAGLR